MLLKRVYMGWKFQRTLELDISFSVEHFFISVAIFTQVASAPLKLYVESPKLMVDKCVVTNCSTSYKTGQKKASFHFHEDQELKRKWIYFVNRKD